jgi:plasmid stabilization system protein ParE
MTFAIIFDANATREWEEARSWIAEHLGAYRAALLDDELARTFTLLEACPKMYPLAPASKTLRRLLLKRSGYHVYYRVFSRKKQIVVMRLWHAKRPL